MDTHDNTASEVIDLGAVADVTAGMMGVNIEGFQLQPELGLSDA
ncbi:hypothetical protein [Caulobacter endophyticus]|nr:hypothetical protein [Caulobacter endophyticus]MDG2528237.1 hypothetical protein [Caulobacter endophyticus]